MLLFPKKIPINTVNFGCDFQEFDYFTTVEDERVTNMQDMDKLAELLSVAR